VRAAVSVSGAAPALASTVRLLTEGELELEGRLVDASNTTLRAFVTLADQRARCVYKPIAGERPLWDFPDGTLAGREVAAYQVSQATGWRLVPPTVLRDGPLGVGACQLWLDEPAAAKPLVAFVPARSLPAGWLRVARASAADGSPYLLAHADDPALARMAIFDAVVNNADRKGAHVLSGVDGELFGVDHGVCFHVEDKLRTVLWGWVGRPLPADVDAVLAKLETALAGALGLALLELISPAELAAMAQRLGRLRAAGVFPPPVDGWPAVPWPPI
jgi:uncharacterized repeat protein (TIGR03843 family)